METIAFVIGGGSSTSITEVAPIACQWGPYQYSYGNIIEPKHDISNNVVCATSKGSDHPAHMRSLTRAFASCLNIL